VDAGEPVAGRLDVFDDERVEQVGALEAFGDSLLDTRVVVVAAADGFLEDRRVRSRSILRMLQ
jgi:hypothetical protein